jgi:hypothetical protein
MTSVANAPMPDSEPARCFSGVEGTVLAVAKDDHPLAQQLIPAAWDWTCTLASCRRSGYSSGRSGTSPKYISSRPSASLILAFLTRTSVMGL